MDKTVTAPEKLLGKGRAAISMFVDAGTFIEDKIGDAWLEKGLGPGAVVGTAKLDGGDITVLSIDAMARNPRFSVVYSGVIGLEEGYKMALAVYYTLQQDTDKPVAEKRPILQIVDSPGNGPGKLEEILGMNKSTGAYQLALAEARKAGHPIVAVIIGRAISGAFLCHGLQADRILALPAEYGTMIHVMPLTSIARITKLDIEQLEELSQSNPVFASGAEYFHRLGGVEEIIPDVQSIPDAIRRNIAEIRTLKAESKWDRLGPPGRGALGAERGGRTARAEVLEKMQQQFATVADRYFGAYV